jgi:hypothetical protein
MTIGNDLKVEIFISTKNLRNAHKLGDFLESLPKEEILVINQTNKEKDNLNFKNIKLFNYSV